MAQTTYTYSITGDTLNGKIDLESLLTSVRSSSIITALERIDTDADVLSIVFKDAISPGDEATLNSIVANHAGQPTFTPTEVKILEETVKTGGRFQCRNVVVDITQSGLNSVEISWPIPVNLLSAEFVIESDHLGDSIECIGGPNTVIGTLANDAAISGTSLEISTPVFDKIEVGFFTGYTPDMANFTELGVVTAVDADTNTVTLSEELTATLPSGTPIYIEAKFLIDFHLWNKTRHTIGDTKVGASYVEAGKKLKFNYYNDSGVVDKKFTIMLEYLY